MNGAITARVITVSDRCAAGERADVSGPLARDLLTSQGVRVDQVVVGPDGVEPVRAAITEAIAAGRRLILTAGGTGISPTDWTPEATEPLLAAQLPGLAEQIRQRGLGLAQASMLSRGLVGVSGRQPGACLVVNAPGSPGGVRDAVAVLGSVLEHLIEQLDAGDH